MSERPLHKPASSEELRRDIDRGLTREKVAVPDPASAPLGTDDEAAGRPPDPEAVRAAREHERAKAPNRPPLTDTPPDRQGRGLSIVPMAVVAALMAVILIAFAAGGLM